MKLQFKKNFTQLLLIYLLFTSFITSPGCDCKTPENRVLNCDSVVTAMRKNADHSINKPVYIVLCDYTSSMDSEGINYVTENALQIFDNYYSQATLKFYPVSNELRSAFFKSEMTQITDSSKVEESAFNDYKHCLGILKSEQYKLLNDTLIALSKRRPSASYIIQSLENAATIIKLNDPLQKNSNRIFILSDMLESGKSTFGNLNLEDNTYLSDIVLVENFTYPASQKFAKNVGIFIGCNAKRIQDMNSLNKFWNLVLNKMGYQSPITLTSEIPILH